MKWSSNQKGYGFINLDLGSNIKEAGCTQEKLRTSYGIEGLVL